MPTPCTIRFTDEPGNETVTICRDRHGHPEHVIGNLAELEELYEAVGRDGSPGEVAAQFLFIDKLWYILFMYERGELGNAIWDLLANPDEMPEEVSEYLSLHSICDESHIRNDAIFYEVLVVRDGNWKISSPKFNHHICDGEGKFPCELSVVIQKLEEY